jgi:DNA-binding NarL/FixJ family response regulator
MCWAERLQPPKRFRSAALRPDVVLVDVHLSEENGLALASEATSVAVFLISTHAEDELAELVAATPGFFAKSDLGAEAVAALVANERRDR